MKSARIYLKLSGERLTFDSTGNASLILFVTIIINCHSIPPAVHGVELTLPLRRDKANTDCGELSVELNDLHVQLPNTTSNAPNASSNSQSRTSTSPVNPTSNTSDPLGVIQNGPTTHENSNTADGGGSIPVSALADDFDLMGLDTPRAERRGGESMPTNQASSNSHRSSPVPSYEGSGNANSSTSGTAAALLTAATVSAVSSTGRTRTSVPNSSAPQAPRPAQTPTPPPPRTPPPVATPRSRQQPAQVLAASF